MAHPQIVGLEMEVGHLVLFLTSHFFQWVHFIMGPANPLLCDNILEWGILGAQIMCTGRSMDTESNFAQWNAAPNSLPNSHLL